MLKSVASSPAWSMYEQLDAEYGRFKRSSQGSVCTVYSDIKKNHWAINVQSMQTWCQSANKNKVHNSYNYKSKFINKIWQTMLTGEGIYEGRTRQR
eukprot:Awhi_evm1s8169